MKIKFNSILLALLAIVIISCNDENLAELNSSAAITPTVDASTVTLTLEGKGTDALKISWPQPDYGYAASPVYTIYFDKEDGDFSAPSIVTIGNDIAKTFKSEDLNTLLLALGFQPGETAKLQIKVEAKIGTYKHISSDVIAIEATPYAPVLDLSTAWGIVGSGYNNWGAFPDAPFFKTETTDLLVAYVTLLDGEIKFREDNNWDNNFGDDGGDGTLENGGANIQVTAGHYKITFNPIAKTYSIESYSWGIAGSAYNDWGATPDLNFTYDDATDQWRALVKLLDGEFKIRKNSDWGTNYGDTGNDGMLEAGGDNIPITAGYYQITFNEKKLTVEIVSIPGIWGIIGSAYNDWGATPDASFDRDWRNDGVWILRNVELLDGEFKFRTNNDWATNYGDDGGDGALEPGGANIAATAGIYTITLDLSDPNNPQWSSLKY